MEKYRAIFFLSFREGLKNYQSLLGLSLFLVTCLLIFSHLWQVLGAKTGLGSFTPHQFLWYIALNEWVLVSLPEVPSAIEEDVRTGRLAYQLPRPISYLGGVFMESFGKLTLHLIVLGSVTFLFTWLRTDSLPFQPWGLFLSVFLGFCSGILGILFLMLIGLSSFWLQDVAPFYWIWKKLLYMFGGLILPLSLYPKWMQLVASYTPFPPLLGTRSALALQYDLSSILHLVALLGAWSIGGICLLSVLYRRGLYILQIGGG